MSTLTAVEVSRSPFVTVSETNVHSECSDNTNRRGIKRKLDDRDDIESEPIKRDHREHGADLKPLFVEEKKIKLALKREDSFFECSTDESASEYECKSVYFGLNKEERAKVRLAMAQFRAEYAERCEMNRNWDTEQTKKVIKMLTKIDVDDEFAM